MYRFAYPQALVLLIFAICFSIYAFKKKPSAITFSQASRLLKIAGQPPAFIVKLPLILRVIAIVLLIFAIARPQKYNILSEIKTSGVDIILCIDASGSMKANDFKIDDKRVNRLQAVKHVVYDFIKKRENDRIGLVVFGEKAYTQCPLTMDKGLLLKLIERIEIGMAGDSTALGLATALGAKRLKNLMAKTKILILLTDGRNNAGNIDPMEAAKAASALGIKIYAIGVGGFGPAPFVVDTVFGQRVVNRKVDLDEDTLKAVAKEGNGRYFRASDSKSLKEIYQRIDKLEKTELNVKKFFNYEELYRLFLIPSLIFFLFEIIVLSLLLRRVP